MFLPGELIVHKGDLGLGIFFVYHGEVSAISCRLLIMDTLHKDKLHVYGSCLYV